MHTTLLPLLLEVSCAVSEAPTQVDACDRCTLTDANQFAYDASLEADVIELVPGADATVDWTGVTRDMQGHPIATEDVSEALLIGFRGLSPTELVGQLAADTLRQEAVSVWLTANSADGTARLSDFGMMGNRLNVQDHVQPGVTWMLAIRQPGTATIVRMVIMVAVEPTPSVDADLDAESSQSLVIVDDRSSLLFADVDFSSLARVDVQANVGTLVLDWQAISVDGLGNPLAMPSVTALFLGRFTESREQLENNVFDLDATAAESWTMRLGGSSWANLDSLAGATPFEGVTSEGTWLLALSCTECLNPAPRVVTFLAAARE